jgi:hypothetical protein
MQQTKVPTISIRANIWITIPIAALIAAILTANFLLLNYVHVFTSMLWTGTDIFMAFLLGPILRNVSLSTRKEVIFWLMPKMIFYMPTVAAVTTTAGYYLASRIGLITLHPPVVYWIFAVLVIVAAMLIQGLGILLPTNLRVYFELRPMPKKKGISLSNLVNKILENHVTCDMYFEELGFIPVSKA